MPDFESLHSLVKFKGFSTESGQRQAARFVLFLGLCATGIGLAGVWMQGLFWDVSTNYLALRGQILHSEVVMSFCLPTIVTAAGGLAIAWVILASKLTEKFSSTQRNQAFIIFAFIFVLAVFVPAKVAGDKMWNKALEEDRKFLQHPASPNPK